MWNTGHYANKMQNTQHRWYSKTNDSDLQTYIDKTWIPTKVLNIPTFSGRKFYYPDLQINKGQLDRIINAAYYQVIIKDHITYPELYSFKKKKKKFGYCKGRYFNLFNSHKTNIRLFIPWLFSYSTSVCSVCQVSQSWPPHLLIAVPSKRAAGCHCSHCQGN